MINDIFILKDNDVKMQVEIDELKEENKELKNENIQMKKDIQEIKEILIKQKQK